MNLPEVHQAVPFGSMAYVILLAVVVFGRGMDLLSTWIATPTLELEANPIARWLGWRAGLWVNLVVSIFVALLPLAAISVATTSLLVAARNLQSAWLMRILGEHEYRVWLAARYRESRRAVFMICLVMHAGLIGLVGLGLMIFSRMQLVPFAIGFGIVTYALAVAVFTGLAMHRAAHTDSASLTTFVLRANGNQQKSVG